MIISDTKINNNIAKYSSQLKNLLAARPIKYSSWSQKFRVTLCESAGVYHFFENNGDSITSLYVGKAGFGRSTWSLYKRLNQHFQVSQKNALIGNIAKATTQSPVQIKESLCAREVYLQWLVLFTKTAENQENFESDLVWSECFCKSILVPTYTNA